MDTKILIHDIPKKAEGRYYTIDFPVPAGCKKVTVSYSYKRLSGKIGVAHKMINIVDLGIMNEQGVFLGWSGSARKSVFIGPHASTDGYSMVPLNPGNWKIIVGAYKIPDAGLQVKYEISYEKAGPSWLKGDLHMHSTASDGKLDIHTLTKRALKKGLDFIAVSNHNNYSENMHLPVVPGLTLIPAVEWTHYNGHMNFFGVKAPFVNSFIANDEEQMRKIVSDAKDMGALISVNHPKCPVCPYLWKDTDVFDMVEVWNGPMRKANMDAIDWWHQMLLKGRIIPLVGGSDFHKDFHPVRMGNPVTFIYSQSESAQDITDAISKGHCYVTNSINGIKPELSCEDRIMGDEITYKPGLDMIIFAKDAKPGMKLHLVTDKGVIHTWKKFHKGCIQDKIPVNATTRFAYLKATRRIFGKELVCAITNPVYFTHA